MNETNELREKLIQFFRYIENQDSPPNINNTINKFEEIFKDNYFLHEEYSNTAYFQQKSKSYYIKNSNGIVLSVFSGDGDRFGSHVSHRGIDIAITSLLSRDIEFSNGIFIFDESKYCKPLLSSKIDNFLNLDISIDNIKKTDNEFIYKTLSNEVNKNEITLYRYNQLKNKAELENSSLYDDYMISPYGGLDIDIIPVDELLYGYLQDFKEEKYFIDRAMALFYCDFPNYFKEEIEECSYALHIIKHKKEYENLSNLREEIYQCEWNTYYIDISKTNKNKNNIQVKIADLLEKRKNLTSKRYNLFELIMGKKTDDQIKISNLTDAIINAKADLNLIEDDILKYNEHLNYYNELKTKYKAFEHKLKKPFKNLSINDEFFDLYIDDKFGELVSLQELIDMKDYYTNKLNGLLENKEKAQKNYEYLKDNLLSKEKIKENDYDY